MSVLVNLTENHLVELGCIIRSRGPSGLRVQLERAYRKLSNEQRREAIVRAARDGRLDSFKFDGVDLPDPIPADFRP